jgi:hypothetical protein
MNKFDNTVLSYISTVSDVSDCDLRIEEYDGQKFLTLYVDIPKIDYNSPSFDESYRRKILGTDLKNAHRMPGLVSSKVFLNRMVNESKKFFGDEIKYETAFLPKNYEYLDDYEKEVEKITKEVEPQLDVEIIWDQDYPIPILKFYFNGKWDIETKDKLTQKIKERINLDTFRTILVHGSKKP